jgi:transcriptional regulator with XRE-family HTH domain
MSLSERIRLAIGDEPVAAFARRCGFGESLLRKYLQGSEPSATNLAKIADAAGVTVDWLATGRGPRTRAEAREAAQNQGDSASLDALAGRHARRWAKLIELVESAPSPEEAEAILDELFARARQQAELAELRQAVRELTAKQKRA